MKNTTKEQLKNENDLLKAKIAELEKNKKLSQLITENTTDNIAITTFDLKAKYLYVNSSVKQVLGYDAKEMVGKSFFDFIHPDDKKALLPLVKKYIKKLISKVLYIEDPELSETIEFRFRDKAGNWRNMQSSVNFIGKYLLAVTRDITGQKKAQEALLQRENYLSALNRAKEILLTSEPENAFQQFVNILGPASNASRTYIFINHKNENGELLMSQKAEYCAGGIKPEIDNPGLQNLKFDDFYDLWRNTLLKGELLFGKIKDFPKEERAHFSAQDIKAILIIPIMTGKECIGCIGFDNCVDEREWDTAEQDFLKAAANDLALFDERNKSQEQLMAEFIRFQTTMDAIDAGVYVADMNTYELLFSNKAFNDLFGDKIGEKCFSVIQKGQKEPCDFCTNHLLLDENGNPKEPYIWEYQNPITKQWYQLRDQAIQWMDGRTVRLEVSTDITERKKAEDALRQSEANLRQIIDLVPHFIFAKDETGKFEIVNKATAEVFGTTVEDLTGRREVEFIANDEEIEYFRSDDLEVIKSGKRKFIPEEQITDSKGNIRYLETIKIPFKSGLSKKPLLLGVAVDITRRKQAEEKYRSLIDDVLDTSAVGIFILDPEFKVAWINRALEKYFGIKREDVIGKDKRQLIQSGMKSIFEDPDTFTEKIFAVYDNNNYIENFECHILPGKDREDRWLSHWSQPITEGLYKNGRIEQYTDITRRKKAGEDLKESKEFAENLLETANSIIVTLNTEANITSFNKCAEELLGYTKEEVIGKNWFDTFIPKNDKELIPIVFKNVLKSMPDVSQHENPILTKSGDERIISWSNNITRGSSGNVNGMLGIGSDITHRKQVEEALKESEEKFRGVIRSMDDIVFVLDKDNRFVSVNVDSNDLYLKPKLFLGKKHSDVVPKHIDDLFNKAMINVKKGEIEEFEYSLEMPDGVHWYALKLSPVLNDGKFDGSVSVVRDITDRKQIEQALQTSEKQFQEAQSIAKIGNWNYDIKNDILNWSDEIHAIFGVEKADGPLSFNDLLKLIHPDDRDEIIEQAKSKSNHRSDYRIIMGDGTLKYIHEEVRNVRNEDDEIIVIRGTAQDITTNKTAEIQLKESQSRFKALSEATSEAIIISDKGIIIDVNQAFTNMSGYSYNESVGMPGTKFIAIESRELVGKNRLLNDKKSYDAIAQRKNGTKFHIEINGRMFDFQDKKVRLTAVRDISVRKKHEILLQESKEKLQQFNIQLLDLVEAEVEKSREKDRMMQIQSKQAALGEMVGNIAHQWRQPLNEIGLYIQNLQDKYEFEELTAENLNETVEKTMNKLEYMSQTIEDFRNFFRSDKEKTRFLLKNSIDKALSLTKASFKNCSIQIVLNLQEGIYITGYPNEFSQVVLNILNNAKDILVERKIENPQVIINLSGQDKKVVLAISDNAGGIDEGIIDKIFEPYFTTRDQIAGTGLGLYISKTIIERNMAGRLSVKNIKDGVEFKIEL